MCLVSMTIDAACSRGGFRGAAHRVIGVQLRAVAQDLVGEAVQILDVVGEPGNCGKRTVIRLRYEISVWLKDTSAAPLLIMETLYFTAPAFFR